MDNSIYFGTDNGNLNNCEQEQHNTGLNANDRYHASDYIKENIQRKEGRSYLFLSKR